MDTNPFRYSGEHYDAETGFIYLCARYYDPSIGRFTAEDPIRDGTNWYVYCYNNPVKYVDPTGKIPVETVIDIFSVGWSFNDFIQKPGLKTFGMLAWDVLSTIIPYAPGSYSVKGLNAGTKLLSRADDYVKSGVWAMKAFDRGYEIERALGGMANNFPVIDKYVRSEVRGSINYLSSATSIKSIDITAASYKNAATLKGTLKGYVDKLIGFSQTTYKGKVFKMDSTSSKILEIALPPVEMTSTQAKIFEEIKDYASKNGVDIVAKIVK